MDKIYKYTGPPNEVALYGPTYTIPESWVGWVQKDWVDALTHSGYTLQNQPWSPTYEDGVVLYPGNDGSMKSDAVNSAQFPTKETAYQLASRYAIEGKPLKVLETPFLGLGPVRCSLLQRFMVDPTGRFDATVPAYQLANYFTNNPENMSSAADALCRLYIERIWPGLLK